MSKDRLSRRKLLKTTAVTGTGLFLASGSAVAQNNESDGQTNNGAQWTEEFVSDNKNTPEWFRIGDGNEAEYKLEEGAGNPFASGSEVGTREIGCVDLVAKLLGLGIGIKFCHHGGCSYTLEACYGACFTMSRDDACDFTATASGELGPVLTGEIRVKPYTDWNGSYEYIRGVKITFELCRYSFSGEKCETAVHYIGDTS